jgi:hypothetical protein
MCVSVHTCGNDYASLYKLRNNELIFVTFYISAMHI